jgi:hypothetical protein
MGNRVRVMIGVRARVRVMIGFRVRVRVGVRVGVGVMIGVKFNYLGRPKRTYITQLRSTYS